MRAFKTTLLIILSSTIFLVFLTSYSKNPESAKHYWCVFSDKPLVKPSHELKSKASSFNMPLTYKPSENYADFDYATNRSTHFQKEGSVFSGSYLKTESQEGYQRDIFQVFRIDLETQILVHSYVYHIPTKDYEKNFKHLFSQYINAEHIFKLVEFPKRKNYVKAGWDKSFWQCRTQSYPQHIINNVWHFFIAILSV
ncbi:MAG: hypothetical protein ACNYPG_05880 [Candidatus Porifericomitaceae bacterium WSBS_2022_MAG_OTU9]